MYIARWSFDVPFGRRADAFAVLDRWEGFAKDAGWPDERQLVGSLGAPESRVEIEYHFSRLADFETALARLHNERFRQWQKDLAPCIVPGSERWEVYRLRQR